ncbi:MAG: DUF4179 domain-containing protein [Lachnospiraceae bacterium]
MKEQNKFSQSDDIRLDDNIKKILDSTFPLPEKVESAKKEAFEKVRVMATEKEKQNDTSTLTKERKSRKSDKKSIKALFKGFIGVGVAVATFCCIYIANPANPAFAAPIPIVGNIFEELEGSLRFAGDYANLAEPVQKAGTEIESITVNGNTITLSEVYCNETALYLSLMIHSEEKIPETQLDQDGKPIIYMKNLVDFDFDEEESIDWAIGGDPYIDGKMIDENTFAGVLRYDMRQYFSNKDIEVPDNFQVKLSVSQIAGSRVEDMSPEMPQELRAQYETGMKENGLGLTEEDYEQFTEEQKNIEHQLFSEMWNAYHEMYPETTQLINKYRDWLMDGPWEFEFDVTKNNEDVIRKDINDVDENGLGLISVTKTPMEITVEVEQNADYFVTILDADGNEMEEGGFTGYTCTVAANGHDTSKIDVYICDYIEYMDELKAYLWSEDYEELAKEKNFKQLLDERSLYHKEIIFDE